MPKKRAHIFVKGRVQGVYFRQGMKDIAEKKNVTGWVRNLQDKRVEAILEGNDEDVNSVIEWSKMGPPNAIVDDVEIINENYKNEFSKFEISI
ncbi:MAG TPA: acylphosphatase [Nitrosopumilaceae archaeon]|nr:acylphosphatase [Nitrosopumilaceae archaeon]